MFTISRVGKDRRGLMGVAGVAAPPQPKVALAEEDWSRWNDYGIGLFLQGDLRASAAIFQKVADIDPQNPDGWVNICRALVQEGDTGGARIVLEKAPALHPRLAPANFFYARILTAYANHNYAISRL